MPVQKLKHGEPDWFAMVGALMSEAALAADLAPDTTLSILERYSDGDAIGDGRVQGIRFDLANGWPIFRVGVGADETADIVIELTKAAARTLNRLKSDDPVYAAEQARLLASGEMTVAGDLSAVVGWMAGVHDPIVERTL
nr:hypothetical protein [Brevundimonas diminuta]